MYPSGAIGGNGGGAGGGDGGGAGGGDTSSFLQIGVRPYPSGASGDAPGSGVIFQMILLPVVSGNSSKTQI
jgi:hypothetical protein